VLVSLVSILLLEKKRGVIVGLSVFLLSLLGILSGFVWGHLSAVFRDARFREKQ